MLDIIKLVSQANTGTFYTTTKNKKTCPEKLLLKKYDPKARNEKTGRLGAHVLFKEEKV